MRKNTKKFLIQLAIFTAVFFYLNKEAEAKVLVAYFSRSGNTQTVAENIIKSLTENMKITPDVFKIEVSDSYPDDYNQTTARAKKEQEDNARPALLTHVQDMSQYDIILLGYPIWWGTLPMSLFTFLEEYDFSGKRVITFNTHEGSGRGRSIDDIKTLIPNANVESGFVVRGTESANSELSVGEWLNTLEFTEPTTITQPIETENPASTSSGGGCNAFSISLFLGLGLMLEQIRRK